MTTKAPPEDYLRNERELNALRQIAASLTFDQPMRGTLDRMAETIAEITDAPAVLICVVDGQQLKVAGTSRLPANWEFAFDRIWSSGILPSPFEVISGRKTVVFKNARRDMLVMPEYEPIQEALQTQAWEMVACMPLLYRGEALGFMGICLSAASEPDPAELRLYETIAGQVAVAVENARLFDETRQRTVQAETLARIAATLTVDQELDDTLQALAEQLVAATNAIGSTASVVVPRENNQPTLRMAGSTGLGPGVSEAMNAVWASSSATVGFEALRSRKPIVLAEGRKALLANPVYAPARHVMRRQTWEAAVWLPLYYHDHAVGLVTAHYPRAEDISDDEVAFLQAIAAQAAIAVETARLFGEASDKAALEERQRLARELHDSVSQALYGIALGARTARTQLERAPEKAVEPIDYVLSLAEAGLAEMRSLIFELRPESLESEGLCIALGKQAEAIRARHQIKVDAELCEEPDAPLATKEAVYRIAQEALHNVVKHARATRIVLQLAVNDRAITLIVRDDGEGFDPDGEFPGHLGLKSMRERASRAGGQLTVESSKDGTSLTATLPIPAHV